ncbi:C-type lectin 37Da-like [Daphnia carinata]|uniref:C-type lectin 37Da-like n=1 Tax=Daphnia carinata TaxID=120202 RepID=UPI00257BAD13|nr:C-type lectin 37Da-like [Daphnia carinata]
MYAFNLPSIVSCIFGVLLFNGQVSQQFAVDVVPQQGSGVVQADAHSAIGEKAVTTAACEGSIGNNKCIKIKDKCTCYVNQQLPWRKAFEFCKTNRKDLISIETAKDQADIESFLMPIILGDEVAQKTGGVWTSGAQVPALDNYYWASKQKLVSFANWFYGEPNSDGTPQCIRITLTPEGTWATASCKEAHLPFICQD